MLDIAAFTQPDSYNQSAMWKWEPELKKVFYVRCLFNDVQVHLFI